MSHRMKRAPGLTVALTILTGLTLLAVLNMAGCAVGPDYRRPDTPVDVPPEFQTALQTASPTATDLDSWWEEFNDETLDQLVGEALLHNHSLDAAVARVLESRATLGGDRAARWPSLSGSASAARARANIATPAGPQAAYGNDFNVSGSASYELDLWGRLSRTEEASRASLLAAEENQRTVMRTLVADVVRTWLDVRQLECQIDLTQRTTASYEQNLQIVENRYQRGLVSSLDLHMTRQTLESTRAQLPQYRQNLAAASRRLEILAGRYPAGRAAAGGEKCGLPSSLPPVPAGLPSDVLQRRPDIRAAEANLHAATAVIGANKANLYPRLNLTGNGGWKSSELTDFFTENNTIWSAIGNLAMPLINRGATKSRIAAAEARRDQALAAWRGTLLGAFADVENALDAEQYQSQRSDRLESAVDHARQSLTLAEDRYRRGLDNLLVLLSTQRSLFQAESNLILARQLRCTARVNLILALGGAWENNTSIEIEEE